MKNIFRLSCSFLLAVQLIACKGPNVKDDISKIRFVNVSSLTGDIIVWMDGQKVYESDIQYLNHTLFSSHISAFHKIQITAAATGIKLLDTTLNMYQGKRYTWYVYDQYNVTTTLGLEENLTPPQGSYCKIRFVDLSNNAPAIDISANADSSILFRNYRNSDYSDYVLFPSGTVNFNVHNTGDPIPFFTQPNSKELKAGGLYTIILQGSVGSSVGSSIDFFWVENNGDY